MSVNGGGHTARSVVSTSSSKQSKYESIAPRYLDPKGTGSTGKYKKDPLSPERRAILERKLEKERNAERIKVAPSASASTTSLGMPPLSKRGGKSGAGGSASSMSLSDSSVSLPSAKKPLAKAVIDKEGVFFNGVNYVERPHWSLIENSSSFSLSLWICRTEKGEAKSEKSISRRTQIPISKSGWRTILRKGFGVKSDLPVNVGGGLGHLESDSEMHRHKISDYHSPTIQMNNSGSIRIKLSLNDDTPLPVLLEPRIKVLVGEWCHIALIVDGESVSFYSNGLLDSIWDLPGTVATNEGPLVVGNDPSAITGPDDTLHGFIGYLASLELIGYALKESEVMNCAADIPKEKEAADEWSAMQKLKDEIAHEEDRAMKMEMYEQRRLQKLALDRQIQEKKDMKKQLEDSERKSGNVNTGLSFDKSNALWAEHQAQIQRQFQEINQNRTREMYMKRQRVIQEEASERNSDKAMAEIQIAEAKAIEEKRMRDSEMSKKKYIEGLDAHMSYQRSMKAKQRQEDSAEYQDMMKRAKVEEYEARNRESRKRHELNSQLKDALDMQMMEKKREKVHGVKGGLTLSERAMNKDLMSGLIGSEAGSSIWDSSHDKISHAGDSRYNSGRNSHAGDNVSVISGTDLRRIRKLVL